jgi:hypothetical protein
MTRRETAIAKAILDYLHDLDGGQAEEIVIHAAASERFMALIPKTEFDRIFAHCGKEGWLLSVPRRFKGTLWSISDAGEKARQEMHEPKFT